MECSKIDFGLACSKSPSSNSFFDVQYGSILYDREESDLKLKNCVSEWCQLGIESKKKIISFANDGDLQAQKTIIMAVLGRIPTLSSKTIFDLLYEEQFNFKQSLENLKLIENDSCLNLLIADYEFSLLEASHERLNFFKEFAASQSPSRSKDVLMSVWELEMWDRKMKPYHFEELRSTFCHEAKSDASGYLGVHFAKLIYFTSMAQEKKQAWDFLNSCNTPEAWHVLSQINLEGNEKEVKGFLARLNKFYQSEFIDKTCVLKIYLLMIKHLMDTKYLAQSKKKLILRMMIDAQSLPGKVNFEGMSLKEVIEKTFQFPKLKRERESTSYSSILELLAVQHKRIKEPELVVKSDLMKNLEKINEIAREFSEEFEPQVIGLEPIAQEQYLSNNIINNKKDKYLATRLSIIIDKEVLEKSVWIDFSLFENEKKISDGIPKVTKLGISKIGKFTEISYCIKLISYEMINIKIPHWDKTKFKVYYSVRTENHEIQNGFSNEFMIKKRIKK